MVRTAARLWQVPENEIDTAFDPLILLMMEACAAELEKIGYDLSASHSRLLDRLASLILPEALLGPAPASAIMHATPVETMASVNPLTRFTTTQAVRTATGIRNTEIFFSPAGHFLLHQVSLAYLLAGNKLYRTGAGGQRDLMAGADSPGSTIVQDIWLAIDAGKGVENLKALSIFFDLRNHSEAGTFYKSLAGARGTIDGKDTGLKSGYYNKAQFEPDLKEMLTSGDDITRKTARRIAGIYSGRFLHIGGECPVNATIEVPEEWQQRLPDTVVKQLAAKPLVYLRISPGRSFYQDALDTISCTINAVPVINRRLNVQNYRTEPWVNIVPVQVEGAFLDLHTIASTSGGGYKFRISGDAQHLEEGEAIVRNAGVSKAGSREVREIIGSLLEAIRDESAFFSDLANDAIQARLKEISMILARLEDGVARSADRRESRQYIMLKPKGGSEQLNIQYWTTNGADANGIKAGTVLIPHTHTLVAAHGAYLITNTAGGRNSLSDTERKNMLKRQLLSKGKIISADDVKLLCAQLFGDSLKAVDVRKGVQAGISANQGFTRTIDVLLTLDDTDMTREERDYLCSELEYTLGENASPVYPFRVMVN
jgi:hypothetical protein